MLCFLGTSLNHQYFDPRIEKHAAELTKVRELAWAEFETETPQISQPPSQFGDPLSILPGFFPGDWKKSGWIFPMDEEAGGSTFRSPRLFTG